MTTKETKLIKQLNNNQTFTAIAGTEKEGMFLPNYSGVQNSLTSNMTNGCIVFTENNLLSTSDFAKAYSYTDHMTFFVYTNSIYNPALLSRENSTSADQSLGWYGSGRIILGNYESGGLTSYFDILIGTYAGGGYPKSELVFQSVDMTALRVLDANFIIENGILKADHIGETTTSHNVVFDNNVTAPNVTDSALTAGRVVLAGTAGLLSDSADFSRSSSNGTVSITTASARTLSLTNNGGETANQLAGMYAPNLGYGEYGYFTLGKAASTANQCSWVFYNYNSTTNNCSGFGFYGDSTNFILYPQGRATINGSPGSAPVGYLAVIGVGANDNELISLLNVVGTSGKINNITWRDSNSASHEIAAIGETYNSGTGTCDILFNSMYNGGYKGNTVVQFKFTGNGHATFGAGVNGVDYSLTFNGYDNDGVLTWMEDEDYFQFSDDILLNSTEKIYFNDTSSYIYDDGTDLILTSNGIVKTGQTFKAGGYQSSDGSAGITDTISFTTGDATTINITVKNGLITGWEEV